MSTLLHSATAPIEIDVARPASRASNTTQRKESFWSRLIAAREAKAQAYVAGYLSRLPDAQLADLGYSPDDIVALRRAGTQPVAYWS